MEEVQKKFYILKVLLEHKLCFAQHKCLCR